jgi:hypothetical protein
MVPDPLAPDLPSAGTNPLATDLDQFISSGKIRTKIVIYYDIFE